MDHDDLDIVKDDSDPGLPTEKFAVDKSVIKRKIEDMLEAKKFREEYGDMDSWD